MKAILIILSLVFLSIGSVAQQAEPLLTVEESQALTQYFNDICGDAWCEGEYELKFIDVVAPEVEQSNYFINFVALGGYNNHQEQRFVSCPVQSSGLVESVVSEMRSGQFPSQSMYPLSLEIQSCVESL